MLLKLTKFELIMYFRISNYLFFGSGMARYRATAKTDPSHSECATWRIIIDRRIAWPVDCMFKMRPRLAELRSSISTCCETLCLRNEDFKKKSET